MLMFCKKRLCLLTILVVATGQGMVVAQRGDLSQLPVGSSPPTLSMPHFPDRLHALVFRNWNVVAVDRIAKVVGATRQQILTIGASMGLPTSKTIPDEYRNRMYLTVIRRNWHLLPYDQLLELLDLSADELAVILREDDFLYVKLGLLKPKCVPIRYVEPTTEVAEHAARIKSIVRETFGDELTHPATPRFRFIENLNGSSQAAKKAQIARDQKPQSITRFIYSYVAVFGDPLLDEQLDPFPDELLARLAAVGVNGVWLHVVLRDLAPGGDAFPEFGRDHEVRLATLRKLAKRTSRHGIGIYLYQNEPRAMPNSFFKDRSALAGVREGDFTAMCTSNPIVRQWINDALAHVFKEVPELAGVFTITASENLTNCASHGQQKDCPHCQGRSAAEIIAEVNQAIRDGVHRSQPDAKVILWDWGWNGHGDASDHIAAMPDDTYLMSVSEWALPIERGGIKSEIGEYSMSAVGPGPRATNHWRLAKQRGLKTFAKVQINNTWELAAVPYLPVLDLVAQHCRNLADSGVDGIMLSWSLGGYPSLNLEVAERFNRQPTPEIEDVLLDVAKQHFGEGGAQHARAAWRAFSDAFREYPYDSSLVYNGPQLLGPSNLLFSEATGYHATMVGFPYDDLASWRGQYPPQIFIQQFERVATGWKEGLRHLHQAVAAAPNDRRAEAEADQRVAEAAQLHFESVVNQSKFVILRERLRSVDLLAQEKADAIAHIQKIVEDEARLARRMFTLTSLDPRIGFEASNQYLYLPLDFVEKVLNCRWVSEQLSK